MFVPSLLPLWGTQLAAVTWFYLVRDADIMHQPLRWWFLGLRTSVAKSSHAAVANVQISLHGYDHHHRQQPTLSNSGLRPFQMKTRLQSSLNARNISASYLNTLLHLEYSWSARQPLCPRKREGICSSFRAKRSKGQESISARIFSVISAILPRQMRFRSRAHSGVRGWDRKDHFRYAKA